MAWNLGAGLAEVATFGSSPEAPRTVITRRRASKAAAWANGLANLALSSSGMFWRSVTCLQCSLLPESKIGQVAAT